VTFEKKEASMKHSIFSSQRRLDESRPSQSGNNGQCKSETLDDDVDMEVIIIVWAWRRAWMAALILDTVAVKGGGASCCPAGACMLALEGSAYLCQLDGHMRLLRKWDSRLDLSSNLRLELMRALILDLRWALRMDWMLGLGLGQ